MRPVHALWPLLIGLVCTETLFEDREGSGNLRQIQVNAADRSSGRQALAERATGWADEPETFGAADPAPSLAAPAEFAALETRMAQQARDPAGTGAGAPVALPQPDLIERTPAAE